jgi:hypothetical protein
MSTFAQIARYLRGGEEVVVRLKRGEGNAVTLLVQPVLAKEPDNVDDDLRRVRAKLARALVLDGEIADLDGTFTDFLNDAADVRDRTAVALESLLASIRADADEAGRKAADRANKRKSGAGAKPASAPEPKSTDKEEQGDDAEVEADDANEVPAPATPPAPAGTGEVDLFAPGS